MVLRQSRISTISSTVIRVCFDSNIFISAFLFAGKPAQVFDLAVDKKIILVTSPQILGEVAKVFDQKFQRNESSIKKQIKIIKDVSQVIVTKKRIKILKYLPDNMVLETAIEGQVDYIVTGDRKHLLTLKEFKKIPIITPAQFLEEIE